MINLKHRNHYYHRHLMKNLLIILAQKLDLFFDSFLYSPLVGYFAFGLFFGFLYFLMPFSLELMLNLPLAEHFGWFFGFFLLALFSLESMLNLPLAEHFGWFFGFFLLALFSLELMLNLPLAEHFG